MLLRKSARKAFLVGNVGAFFQFIRNRSNKFRLTRIIPRKIISVREHLCDRFHRSVATLACSFSHRALSVRVIAFVCAIKLMCSL